MNMMNDERKTIQVTIDQLGNPKVEAIGFKGVGCGAATEAIEKALAAAPGGVTKVMKPEWTETETNTEEATVEW